MPGRTQYRVKILRAAQAGVAAFLLCLGIAGLLSAQDPGSEPGDVTFRTGTELIQVDVIVQQDGKPVGDLTQDDFTLTDDDELRKISVFSVRRAEPAAGPGMNLPPGVVTNQPIAEGRSPVAATVILLDFMNPPPQTSTLGPATVAFSSSLMNGPPRKPPPTFLNSPSPIAPNSPLVPIAYAVQQAIKYVDQATLTEPLAIFSMNQTVKQLQDFTTDREKLLGVLRSIKPEQPLPLSARRKAEMLRAAFFTMARYLQGVPGRKKLVWITYGARMTTTDPISATRAANGMQLLPEYINTSAIFEDPIAIINDANVGIYPLDPSGLMRDMNDPLLASLNFFATRTGGATQYLVNDVAGAIDNVMHDTEVTYTLGFYLPADAKEGSHDLRVRVNRKGVDVRYRRGYTAKAEPKPLNARDRFKTLSAWLVEPLDATGIVLRASAAPVPDAPGSFDVTLAIDPLSLDLELRRDRWHGVIDIAIVPDTRKKPVGMHQSIIVNLKEQTYIQALQTGILIRRRIRALKKKGKLLADDLRVGVVDGITGKVGTVRIPIELSE